ncbi:unnamed protein product [Pocillopora meandrina]|uniref:Uncharacterized protein n=1 Tax=Pocillopora meandrina TaxID=46732 RepID=A0AAU9W932_9CNID|nr:unnamed protein product [Pocillopora meandrina]
MEDYAKYQCAANNSVGRSKSGMAAPEKSTPTPTHHKNGKPENSASQTNIIAVSYTMVAAVMCVVSRFVWNRRKKSCQRGK